MPVVARSSTQRTLHPVGVTDSDYGMIYYVEIVNTVQNGVCHKQLETTVERPH